MSPEAVPKNEEIRQRLRRDYDVQGDDLGYLERCLRANLTEMYSGLRVAVRNRDWDSVLVTSKALHSVAANLEWGELRRAAAALQQCAEHRSQEMIRRVLMKLRQILSVLD